jgi:hypothetical protein
MKLPYEPYDDWKIALVVDAVGLLVILSLSYLSFRLWM